MKWVRDGKVYDTGTAKEILTVSVVNLFSAKTSSLTLYRSPKGTPFVVNESTNSIEILSEETLYRWLEEHDATPDAYEGLGFSLEEG